MVLYIAHRVNKSSDVSAISHEYGIECDIREGFVVTHDHGTTGESFTEFNKSLDNKRLVILNVKCEGIEQGLIEAIKCPYFLLDCGFPMIRNLKNKNTALRFSEYERMDTLRTMAGQVDWVWLDSFEGIHIKKAEYDEMKALGYKVCIVSPELQGRSTKEITEYANYLVENGMGDVDAICTKLQNIELWRSVLDYSNADFF
jgi:hypothetical protein